MKTSSAIGAFIAFPRTYAAELRPGRKGPIVDPGFSTNVRKSRGTRTVSVTTARPILSLQRKGDRNA